MTKPLHRQLLEQARHLAVLEPRRPLQASVRRSVSASYYALFHFLAWESAALHAGRDRRARAHRELLMRCLKHGEMAEASKAFRRGWDRLPVGVQRLVPERVIHARVERVAKVFVDLQQLRHAADYDKGEVVERRTALHCVAIAGAATEGWSEVAREPSARAFLACLSCWQRTSAR